MVYVFYRFCVLWNNVCLGRHECLFASGMLLQGLSTKVITKDEGEDAMEADDKRLYLSGSSSVSYLINEA